MKFYSNMANIVSWKKGGILLPNMCIFNICYDKMDFNGYLYIESNSSPHLKAKLSVWEQIDLPLIWIVKLSLDKSDPNHFKILHNYFH